MRSTVLVILTVATLLFECRTIWIHPDATPEKYEDDKFFWSVGN